MADVGNDARVAQQANGALKRAPAFDEVPLEEQVRRLKAVVVQIGEQNRHLWQAVQLLQAHSHNSQGEIVVPLHAGRIGEAVGGSLSIERQLR